MECPDAVKRLIERFNHQSDQVRSPDYNETQLRIDFINPLFAALGWDMDNAQGYAEQYREVVHEDRIKVYGATKAPDYSFRIGGVRKFFLEAKKPAINIKQAWEPAYQLRRYAWSAKLPVSILTDFEELAIYDCRIAPKQMDKPATARREYITYTDYCNRWDFLYGTFSKDAVLKGDFDRYCASQKGRGAQEFDDAFLFEIEEWRKKLASNLALRNDLSEHDLNFATQRIIDRVIFLRICEDRGVEPTGHLQQLLNGDNTYKRLVSLFRDADARYNSGLFHFKRETGREEAPDELTLDLEVDDAALKTIFKRLYYPESPYEFTVVSADILGSVYERFLGNIIERRGEHGIKVVEKPEVRKAGGVYYTPTYIVDYIVKQTVGRLLDGKTPKEAAKLKVLDPACGSGSFLLGAYQYLLDWHLKWYVADGPQKWSKGKTATIRPADRPSFSAGNAGAIATGGAGDGSSSALTPEQTRELGHWALTIAERKRILLDNIHGVDIDYQAVEVTKLSLLLRCLEGETAESVRAFSTLFRERALPDLGRNIQCGNSLVGTDIMTTEAWKEMSEEERSRLNPFDYERAFKQVFRAGQFDVVIGNPPYIRMEWFTPLKDFLSANYAAHEERADLYTYFIERGLRLLNKRGRLGEILSNKFIRARYGLPLRKLIAERADVLTAADFAGADVFHGATVRTLILILGPKGSANRTPIYVPVPSSEVMQSLEQGRLTVDEVAARSAVNVADDAFGSAEWKLMPRDRADLLDKLRRDKEVLHEFIGGKALFGLKTGLNAAFVVDGATAKSLDPSGEVVKPILFGKDIRRYGAMFHGRFVIYLHPDRSIDKYPKIKRHLEPFRKPLSERAGPQRWFELQQPAVALLRYQRKPKIVYPIIANECRFAFDSSKSLVNDKSFILPSTDAGMLALLNSRVANFFFGEVCAALEGQSDRYLEFRAQYVDLFPVPSRAIADVGPEKLRKLGSENIRLHEREAKMKSPQQKEQLRRRIEATDRQIDQLVYQLYDLTDDEIKLVEQSTQPSGD